MGIMIIKLSPTIWREHISLGAMGLYLILTEILANEYVMAIIPLAKILSMANDDAESVLGVY